MKNKIKSLFFKFFQLKPIIMIMLVLISSVSLFYIFVEEIDYPAFAYISYLVSAYTLVVVITFIVQKGKVIQSHIENLSFVQRYQNDVDFQMKAKVLSSLIVNVLYAVMKLGIGILYQSFWDIQIAIYYILICGCRFTFLNYMRRYALGQYPQKEYIKYKHCGYFLMGINMVWIGTTILMVWYHHTYDYPGTMIYVAALYAFYTIGVAMKNIIRYRKSESPIIKAMNCLHFVTACLSIFSLQTAMLTQFGDHDSIVMQQAANGMTGTIVCALIVLLSVSMIRRSYRELNKVGDCEIYE